MPLLVYPDWIENKQTVWRVIASFSDSQERHWCSTRFDALFIARMILLQPLTVEPERVEIVSPAGNVEAYSLADVQPCAVPSPHFMRSEPPRLLLPNRRFREPALSPMRILLKLEQRLIGLSCRHAINKDSGRRISTV